MAITRGETTRRYRAAVTAAPLVVIPCGVRIVWCLLFVVETAPFVVRRGGPAEVRKQARRRTPRGRRSKRETGRAEGRHQEASGGEGAEGLSEHTAKSEEAVEENRTTCPAICGALCWGAGSARVYAEEDKEEAMEQPAQKRRGAFPSSPPYSHALPPRAKSTEPRRAVHLVGAASTSTPSKHAKLKPRLSSPAVVVKDKRAEGGGRSHPFSARIFSNCLQPSVRRTPSPALSSAHSRPSRPPRHRFAAAAYEPANDAPLREPQRAVRETSFRRPPPARPPARISQHGTLALRNNPLRRSEPTRLPSLNTNGKAGEDKLQAMRQAENPKPARRNNAAAVVPPRRQEDVERLCYALLRAAVTEQRRWYDGRRKLLKLEASIAAAGKDTPTSPKGPPTAAA